MMCQLGEVGSYFTLSQFSYRIVRIRDYSSMPVLLSATSVFLSTPGLVEPWNARKCCTPWSRYPHAVQDLISDMHMLGSTFSSEHQSLSRSGDAVWHGNIFCSAKGDLVIRAPSFSCIRDPTYTNIDISISIHYHPATIYPDALLSSVRSCFNSA